MSRYQEALDRLEDEWALVASSSLTTESPVPFAGPWIQSFPPFLLVLAFRLAQAEELETGQWRRAVREACQEARRRQGGGSSVVQEVDVERSLLFVWQCWRDRGVAPPPPL